MSPLNWSKTRKQTAMRTQGAIDKAIDRERRENDRAAKWLAKVEAGKGKKRERHK